MCTEAETAFTAVFTATPHSANLLLLFSLPGFCVCVRAVCGLLCIVAVYVLCALRKEGVCSLAALSTVLHCGGIGEDSFSSLRDMCVLSHFCPCAKPSLLRKSPMGLCTLASAAEEAVDFCAFAHCVLN